MNKTRPQYSPYVEISLDNLLENFSAVRSKLMPGVDAMAVIKDGSYGNGSVLIAKTLEREAAAWFFVVARAHEAIALRKSGVHSQILVLGFSTENELRFGADKDISFALNDLSELDRWKSYDFDINCHIGFDTGMGRLGIAPSEVGELIDAIKSTPNVDIEGIYTHMARADEPDTDTVGRQLEIFRKCIDALHAAGIKPHHIHYANSPTTIRFPLWDTCTLARPGISLYGCKPDPAQEFNIKVKPVASLRSSVVKMKKVPAGTAISYGGNYVTPAETWIATIHLGYAHGLPRFLSSKGEVLIKGKRYRIAGNVTMDYIMVDAGADPVIKVGDAVVAIGTQGDETITADDVAVIGNTIGYEILCNLGTSIDRFYILNGKVVHHDPGTII
ncbi:MAG: alanine racemase [Chitinispirillia bacterium]|nr:alanine racemase [Chitinispirillia bacterium]MCL2269574.1 alanine racemase [Chitinispirillia bacterium]